MTTIIFRDTENKVLFDYPKAASLSDEADRLVFLSRRDFYLLLNSIEYIGKFRKRLYTSHLDEVYTLASEEQWQEFKGWVEELENNLGGWAMSNEFLERIAIANETMAEKLTAIDEKTEQLFTIDQILDQLGTTLGIVNPLYLLVKYIKDLMPGLQLKVNVTTWITALLEYLTWKAPILSLLGTISASLVIMAAAAVGQKVDKIFKDLQDATSSIVNMGSRLLEFINGTWNWFTDIFTPILDEFIPESEGGEGGDDPDSDPELRTVVNVATNVQVPVNVNCSSCGSSGGCSCGGTGFSSDTPLGDVLDEPTAEEPDREGDPPTGYPTWEDYDDDKCARIKEYMDRLIGTLRNLGTLVEIFGTLTIALIAGLISVELAASGRNFLYSLLAQIYTQGAAAFGSFVDIANHLEENLDEIICEMQDQDTTDGMIEQLHSAIGEAVASLGLFDPDLEGWLEGATELLASTNSMNSIITSTTVPEGYESYTCPCGGAPCGFRLHDPFEVGDDAGDVTIEGNHVTILPTFQAGRWAVAFQFSTDLVPNACAVIDNIVVTDANHVTYRDNWIACGDVGYDEIASPHSFEILETECVHSVLFQADPNDGASPGTQPTIQFDIVECCEPE